MWSGWEGLGTTVIGCAVNAGGGGVVTYKVDFRGGQGWTPASNYRNGAYTINVVGGQGSNSGLDAVINGAPVQDTVHGVQTYVLFPVGLVLEARC